MGLVNSALQIGRSAITSYQGALSIVGNNIANAADPDYTRQRAVLEPVQGAALPEGIKAGGGVVLDALERVIDEALEARLRDAISDAEEQRIGSQILGELEAAFDELGENGMSTLMSGLFSSFLEVQTDASNVSLRAVLLSQAESLASMIQLRPRSALASLIDGIGERMGASAERADLIASEIADLNVDIVAAESDGHPVGSLRDKRDALLRELSEIVHITVRPQDSGSVNVFIGNEMLIQYGSSRGLMIKPVTDGDSIRYELRFRDNEGLASVRGGLIGGLLALQDSEIGSVIDALDQLARGLIAGVNEVHSNGQGLEGFTALTGTREVLDVGAALNDPSAGLEFLPQSGSFFVAVTDVVSGRTEAHRIDVDLDGAGGDDTTLSALVEAISTQVANVTASISIDNRLELRAESGFTFTFGHDGHGSRADTSGALMALGVNTFFTGTGASDIQVNDTILARPELLAAASVPYHGEGVNAGLLADVETSNNATLDDLSLSDFINQMIVNLGAVAEQVNSKLASADSVLTALRAQRASVSGVNLDEEAVELLRYERAFQGAARYTSVVDELIAELLNIVR